MHISSYLYYILTTIQCRFPAWMKAPPKLEHSTSETRTRGTRMSMRFTGVKVAPYSSTAATYPSIVAPPSNRRALTFAPPHFMHNQRLDSMEKMNFTLLRRLSAVPPLFQGQRTDGERVKRVCLNANQNRGKKIARFGYKESV